MFSQGKLEIANLVNDSCTKQKLLSKRVASHIVCVHKHKRKELYSGLGVYVNT